MQRLLLLLSFSLTGLGCADETPQPATGPTAPRAPEAPEATGRAALHPRVDFDHWASIFPIETFEQTEGPRRFNSSADDDPVDLWKSPGSIITSPAHLCEIELVRKAYEKTKDLGRAVPVDIFLWSVAAPTQPFLTKLGGIPHREAAKPWPTFGETQATFVAQFCFVDSRDIVAKNLPGDVMLVFFKDSESYWEEDEVHLEWSSIELAAPATAKHCTAPSFAVPNLSGHIHRTNAYPDSWDVFEQEGHSECYLFPSSQSTKIGRETFYTQNDPRKHGQELFCALNSVQPDAYSPDARWHFIGQESLPDDWDEPGGSVGQQFMMLGDVGCMYFMIDEAGKVTWAFDCY